MWFTLDEPSLDKWPPDADSDGWDDEWGSYFGLDGFTKCSHMLTVTHWHLIRNMISCYTACWHCSYKPDELKAGLRLLQFLMSASRKGPSVTFSQPTRIIFTRWYSRAFSNASIKSLHANFVKTGTFRFVVFFFKLFKSVFL